MAPTPDQPPQLAVQLGDFLLQGVHAGLEQLRAAEGLLHEFPGVVAGAAAGRTGGLGEPLGEFVFVLPPTELDAGDGLAMGCHNGQWSRSKEASGAWLFGGTLCRQPSTLGLRWLRR